MKNAIRALFFAAAFTAGGFSQGIDTARVPVVVNVNAAVRAAQGDVTVTRNVTAAKADTLLLLLPRATSVWNPGEAQGRLSAPALTGSGGNITLELPAQSYKNAEITLHSVNGRRVLRGKAASEAASGVSRRNVAPGVYLLSVKGVDGSSFSARLTHGGGRLSVNVAFGGEGSPSARQLGKASAAGDWRITVSAPGYNDTSYTINPVKGINPTQRITLRAESGFTPEMLGLTPGATIAGLNLNWISTNSVSTGGDKALVRVYDAGGALVETFTGRAAAHTTGKRYHKVSVAGLTPNTSYKYAVSNNGNDWSYKYNYKTPPSGNVFTIAVVADAQITDGDQDSNTKPKADPPTVAQGWKATVDRIAATDATLIICNGDQVDEARTYTESQYVKFFAPDAMRSLPLSPTIGNHDLHAEFLNHFNMPNMTSTSSYEIYSGGINYYYLYNNILVVVINTGSFPQKQSDADSYVAKYKKTMDAAKAAHAGQYDWLMVSYHKSTTSISSHACDKEMEYYVKAGLEKMITESGVDVVLTGHDHILVRSHLMKWDNNKGHSVRSTDGKGAIYLTVSTASGGKFYPAFFILEPGSNQYVSEYTEEHPVLVDGTKGWKEFGMVRGKIGSFTGAINPNKIPLSVDYYVQGKNAYDYTPNYTPNYTIFEVNGKTIKAKTYGSIDNAVVDEYTLTPRGR